MLFYQFIILLISNFIVNIIASPIYQQKSFEITSANLNIPTLEEAYETIVKDIVEITIQEIIDVAPDTFLTIHELQYSGREYCRTSLYSFINTLKDQLDQQIRDSLCSSIKPLLETINYKDVLELNQYMSQQLGAIINPPHLSHQIIQQVYSQNEVENISLITKLWKTITSKQWYLTIHHEFNESKALESWLRSWLMDIESDLKDHFDSKIPIII